MVRILIVEDQKIMQKYFEYIIMQEPEFRHIQTDKRVDRIEQLQRELLDKLCFAHTRGADEDKAGRTAAR